MRDERRAEDRIDIGVIVDEGTAASPHGLCRALNVSRTGMYLLRVPGSGAGPARFAWLGFHLPDGQAIRALVEVVHTRRVGALEASGVRFKHLFPEDKKRLDAYLAAQDEAA